MSQEAQNAPVSNAQGTPTQGQGQQQNAPETTPQAGRKVYGLDGEDPVPEKEFFGRNAMPEYQQDGASRAVQNAVQEQMAKPEAQRSDAEYWKGKATEYQQKYESVAKYDGIIGAMERDGRLVDVMQRAIAGDMVDEEDRREGRDLREFDDDDHEGSTRQTLNPRDIQRREQAAEERGRRQAEFQLQLQQVQASMLQDGATEEEVDQFVEFCKNPAGVTALDLLNVYKGRNGAQSKPQQPRQQQPGTKKQMPPSPVAAMSGSVDRPNVDRYTDEQDSGHYYPGDPNTI